MRNRYRDNLNEQQEAFACEFENAWTKITADLPMPTFLGSANDEEMLKAWTFAFWMDGRKDGKLP